MSDFTDLRQYVTMLIRWWWLMLLGAVVAAAIGYGVSQRQPRTYEAFTTLIVGQSIQATQLDSRDILTSERLAQTYADIARRQPIMQASVESLQLSESWRALKKRVSVKLIEGTQLLEIRAEGDSPEAAQQVADEVARQLILISPTADLQNLENNTNQQFVHEQLQALQEKIEAGQARIKKLEEELVSSTSSKRIQAIPVEINALERLVADWQANYVDLLPFLGEKRSANYLTVIEPAQVNSSATRPQVSLNTVLAGAVGLVLALGVVFLRERLDETLKSPDDLSRALGVAYLGSVGRIEGKHYASKLLTLQGPFSPTSEAYRIIRSNVQLKFAGQPTKVVMVTSAVPGEGKSILAANLGVVMAQAGLKTILLDVDLRRPVQHEIFEVPNLGGMTSLLVSPELEINGHLIATSIENLQVIPSGVLPLNPSELISSHRMELLLSELKTMADVIIVDSSPVLPVADAAVLSAQVDGVVLVIDASKTHRDTARQARLNLQQAGAHVLGAVLNRVPSYQGGHYARAYVADVYSRTNPLKSFLRRFDPRKLSNLNSRLDGRRRE